MKATRDGFGEAMYELVAANREVVVVTADLAESVRLEKIKQDFPDQFVECGICEQNMVGVAAGIAMTGKKVVTAGFAAFHPGRNWEQIRVSICEQNLDVKIVGSHAGLATGPDGATHQALEDVALMSALPRMKILVPADANEAKEATKLLVSTDGPGYLRLSREPTAELNFSGEALRFGRGRILQQGEDAVIFTCGLTVELAMRVSDALRQEADLEVTVVDMATVVPLDEELVATLAAETNAVVTLEEHQVRGGLGSMIATYLAEHELVPIEIVGIEGKFGQSGTKNELWKEYGLTADAVCERVMRAIERKKNFVKYGSAS